MKNKASQTMIAIMLVITIFSFINQINVSDAKCEKTDIPFSKTISIERPLPTEVNDYVKKKPFIEVP